MLKQFTLFLVLGLLLAMATPSRAQIRLHSADSIVLRILERNSLFDCSTTAVQGLFAMGTSGVLVINAQLSQQGVKLKYDIQTTKLRISLIDINNRRTTAGSIDSLRNIFVGERLMMLDTFRLTGNNLTDSLVGISSWDTAQYRNILLFDISNNQLHPRFLARPMLVLRTVQTLLADRYSNNAPALESLSSIMRALNASPDLQFLNLSHNRFMGASATAPASLLMYDTAQSTSFHGSLLNLYCDSCNIGEILTGSSAIAGTHNTINVVSLRDNQLNAAAVDNLLKACGGLDSLWLDNGLNDNINSLQVPNSYIAFNTSSGHSLRYLSISNNYLIDIDTNLFKFCFNIMYVDMSHNILNTTPLALWEKCDMLEHLNLAYNRLRTFPIPSSSFLVTGTAITIPYYRGVAALRNLDLSHNQIRGSFPLHYFFAQALRNMPPQIRRFAINNNDCSGFDDLLARATLQVRAGGSFTPQFSNLDTIRCDSNRLLFRDLYNLAIGFNFDLNSPAFVPVVINGDSVGSLYVQSGGTDTAAFIYSPQDSLGIGGVRRRALGESMSFPLAEEDFVLRSRSTLNNFPLLNTLGIVRNSYEWALRDTTGGARFILARYTNGVLNPFAAANTYGVEARDTNDFAAPDFRGAHIPSAQANISGKKIILETTNKKFPELTLYARPKTIIVGDCLDSLGRVIRCQEIAVQFDLDSLHRSGNVDSSKQALREEFGATVLDSCVCGLAELWAISDTVNQDLNLQSNGFGTRTTATSAQSKPGLKSADPNYDLMDSGAPYADTSDLAVATANGNRTPRRTLIALIDSGTDLDHPALNKYLHVNTRETANDSIDNDNNCEIDDYIGYNYFDKNNRPDDDLGHGTEVAGILAGLSTPAILPTDTTAIDILPIRYTNYKNEGTSYHASCAIYYAADYHINHSNSTASSDSVRVINASWGYIGESCRLLKDAIKYAGDNCGILFVTAAGNEHLSLSDTNYYPAKYPLSNILVVTAANSNGTALSSYANYSADFVDIAAAGTFSRTTLPKMSNNTGFTTTNIEGTSFATPMVARAAAILYNQYPDATYTSVIDALMNTATPIQGNDSLKVRSRGVVNIDSALAYMARLNTIERTNCSDILITSTPTIANNDGKQSLKIYPNPTQQSIFIEFANTSNEEIRVQLFDIEGKLHFNQFNKIAYGNAIELPINELPAGFYILQIQQGNKRWAEKVIKLGQH